MSVPVLSIVFMALSAIVAIGIPVCLFVLFRKKYNLKVLPMLLGIAGFIIFALVLESLVHRIVLGKFLSPSDKVLYIIYGAFMAGIFEETTRFIAFNILKKKKYEGIGTALSYGIGHGGIESVLLVGLSMISSIVMSIIVNTGNIEILTGNRQGEALAAINNQITELVNTAPHLILVGAFERVSAIAVHLSLSVVVFYAVFGKKKVWLYPLAIVLHALVDTFAMIYQTGGIKSIFLLEVIVFLLAAGYVLFAKFLHGKLSATLIPDPVPASGQ